LDTDNNFFPSVLTVPVKSATGDVSIEMRFSLPLKNNEEKQNIALKINLGLFFPKSVSSGSPTLKKVTWVGDDYLIMNWERIAAGVEERHFYKFTIPGGKNGITKEDGSYMKEDFIVYLEAVK